MLKIISKIKNQKTLLIISTIFAVITLMFTSLTQKSSASGTISGTVYIDYNMNGVRDTAGTAPNLAIDGGLGGVTVTVYAASGASKSATTAANGTYSINTATAPALPAGPYRIEFTNLPAGYYPSATGTNNATTVRIVADGTSNTNDLGVIVPSDYCQINPVMINNVYGVGPGVFDTIVKFPYNYSEELDGRLNSVDPTAWTAPPSRTSLLAPTGIAAVDPVGATFGLTYDNRVSKLYAAAYVKRGAVLGSLSGESTGAIYLINNPAGNSPAESLYVDLNAVFGAGTAGANPHPTATTTDWTDDAATVPFVGKRGLGGLKVSLDGTKLYTVNLNDRRLYVIPTSGTLNSTTITRFDIPTTGLATSSGNCAAADVRPFAVGRSRTGQIYVGAVCSAESEAADTKLHAFIWRFTGAAFTLVANNTLTFARNASIPPTIESVNWQRWLATAPAVLNRAAPVLTDIEFDGADMILGFRDRFGDQVVLPDFYRGYGDVMRVCDVSGTFTFESNGICGSVTSTNPGSNGNTGNGGREFYSDLNGDGRQEGGLGGLTQVPGYNHVITSFYDPVTYNSAGTRVSNFYTSGIQRYGNTTGAMTGAYDVYLDADPGNFGKADGAGDTEALCNAAPLQIGNRVWNDTNGNGIQEPNETGIANVAVQLWADTNSDGTVDTQIGTATTDASGNYIFGGPNNTNLSSYTCGTILSSLDVRVTASSDDAEQVGTTVTLNSGDLDLDGTINGVRFSNLAIPPGATITNAYIQFTANNTTPVSGGSPTFTIRGQNADTAATFTTAANNISSRATTTQSVAWSPAVWATSSLQNTPDLTSVVQAVVSRAGWTSGNSMAFIISGGTAAAFRTAESFDGIAAAAPRLVIEYTTPSSCVYSISPNTNYEVRLPATNFNAGQPLNTFAPTTSFSDATANGTIRDSNGIVLSGNQVIAPLTTGDIGQNNHTYDFGFRTATTAFSIGNRVWFDTNNNGIIDGAEVGISGVSVSVFLDANSDGQPDNAASPLGTVTTDASGYYRFDGLSAGNYVVRINPSNFNSGGVLRNYANTSGNNTANTDSSGAGANAENGINPAVRNSIQTNGLLSNTVTLNTSSPTAEPDIPASGNFSGQGSLDNQANATIDLGFYNLSLSGTVWNDTSVAGNNDGLLNNGETGISGAVVLLYDSANVQIPVGLDGILGTEDDAPGGMLTDASGNYSFRGLAPGTYRVLINSSGGGTSSTPTQTNADNNVDSDDNGFPDNTGNFPNRIISGLVVLTAGGEPVVNNAAGTTSNPTVDFGFILAPTMVKLENFDVYTASDGTTTVRWSTASEVSNLGFNVYREAGGKREKITNSPIAGTALRSQITLNATSEGYSWRDNAPVSGAVYYLEDIDMKGTRTMHGPVAPKLDFSNYSRRADSGLLSDLTKLSNSSMQTDSVASIAPAVKPPKNAKENLLTNERQFEIAAKGGVKIAVRSSGWYRVTLSELVNAGFEINSDPNNWQLFADAVEVPFKLNTDGSIEFFGHGLDTPETATQTYYLLKGDSAGQRLPEQSVGEVEPGKVSASFRNTATLKERSIYFSGIPNSQNEKWFGALIFAGTDTVNNLTVHNPSAEGQAHLKVKLQGVGVTEHLIRLKFNNLELGTVTYDNFDNEVFEFDVPMSAVVAGENSITMTALGTSFEELSAVDEISLTYERLYTAQDNKLAFTVPAGSQARLEGFGAGHIKVAEINDGKAVRYLEVQPQETGNGFGFSLDAENYDRAFVALADAETATAASVIRNNPSKWNKIGNRADFVIITPESLRGQADSLASVRESEGLRTKVVLLEDIYDEFGFGASSVSAVKEFLRKANDDWQLKPGYVLLFGDSSYDMRNYLAQPDRNLVPTKLVQTLNFETSSDAWIADFDDDGIEDISIGRLPVGNTSEAQQVVGKLLRPQRENVREEKTNLFVADSGFDASVNALRETLPQSVGANVVRRSEFTNEQTRQEIIRETNFGQSVITYEGHGSPTAWSNGSFFRTTDAANLQNTDKLSLYLLMTCLNGYTSNLDNDTLAESLIKSNGGAYAAWVSSGATNISGQTQIIHTATDLIFRTDGKQLRLGDISRMAKQSTQDLEIRQTWLLIGDPTMFVR